MATLEITLPPGYDQSDRLKARELARQICGDDYRLLEPSIFVAILTVATSAREDEREKVRSPG